MDEDGGAGGGTTRAKQMSVRDNEKEMPQPLSPSSDAHPSQGKRPRTNEKDSRGGWAGRATQGFRGRLKVDDRFESTFMRTRMQGCGVSDER